MVARMQGAMLPRRSMVSIGSSSALSLAYHRRRQMLERRRAHLLEHGARFDAEDFEHPLDTSLTESDKTPEIGPADADRFGAHAQRLDHAGSAAEAGVH